MKKEIELYDYQHRINTELELIKYYDKILDRIKSGEFKKMTLYMDSDCIRVDSNDAESIVGRLRCNAVGILDKLRADMVNMVNDVCYKVTGTD